MYSLHLSCSSDQLDWVLGELYDAGTAGVRELDADNSIHLIAGFEENRQREQLLKTFERFSPEWRAEDDTDWIQYTKDQWQPRAVGERLWLVPYWSEAGTPHGRIAVRHNPGLACGTGEHPCTQLALEAVEAHSMGAKRVLDIGTGSGILAVAASLLGAAFVVATDTDETVLGAARENFELNGRTALLATGSADCIANAASDLTVANISGTVLLTILEDLIRVTSPEGTLVLTGFNEDELRFFSDLFRDSQASELDGWACLTAKASSYEGASSLPD